MLFKNISRGVAIVGAVLMMGLVYSAVPQDMQNMPGMKMGNSNSQKKRRASRKKPAAKKHNMANMSGINMPGMKIPKTSPSPSASPQKMGMTMPGMQMPTASPNP